MTPTLDSTRSYLFLFFLTLFFSQPINLQATVYFVNTNVVGGNQDGSNWEHAFSDLQDALDVALNGDDIWVAKGTYYPTTDGDRNVFFRLIKGVEWLGGFEGWETEEDERDWENNATILSGDIGIPGDNSDNSYTVVFSIFSDWTTRVNGFTITGGNADNDDDDLNFYHRTKCGGGAYIHGQGAGKHANPGFINCTFINNHALQRGGAIYLNGKFNGDASSSYRNCQFISNSAAAGGAVFEDGGSTDGHGLFWKDCLFKDNYAESFGGAVHFEHTNAVYDTKIHDCRFENNSCLDGGAVSATLFNNPQLEFKNCDFVDNETPINGVGAAIFLVNYKYRGGLLIEDSFFSGNYLPGQHTEGSAILAIGPPGDVPINPSKNIQITNCIFYSEDNTAVTADRMNLIVDDCYFSNNLRAVSVSDRGKLSILNTNFNHCTTAVHLKTSDVTFGGEILTHQLVNCLFSTGKGTDLLISADHFQVVNCTFSKTAWEADPFAWINQKGEFINTIFWHRYFDQPLVPIMTTSDINTDLNFSHCLFSVPNCDSIFQHYDGDPLFVNCLNNNLFEIDPLFDSGWDADYRLTPCSPLINAGDNQIIEELGIEFAFSALLEEPRIQDGTVDLGAYENPLVFEDINIQTTTQSACAGIPSGSIAFNVENACEPYNLQWSQGSVDSNYVENLAPGTYQFTLTDAKGRKDTVAAEITTLDALELSSLSTAVDCETGVLGTVQVTPINGTAPFEYLWSNGQTEANLQNILPGDYQVTVTDANGCSEEISSQVLVNGQLSLAINVIPISCHDTQDGVASVNPVNGTAPYQYQWASGITDSVLTNLGSGTYEITVNDAIGCTDELSFTINAPEELDANFETQDLKCSGDQSGMAIVFPTGGTAPFQYNWSNLSQNDTLSNVPAGTYALTILDAHDCAYQASVTILEPPLMVIEPTVGDISCWQGNDGWVALTVEGGVPDYQFLWSTGDTTSEINNLMAGDYSFTITDANGCEQSANFFFSEPSFISIDETNLIMASTPWDNDGSIEIQALSGGTPPYEYLWSTGATSPGIDSLLHGPYEVTITDANGCELIVYYEVQFISATRENVLNDQILTIYPNPVSKNGLIHFSLKEKGTVEWQCSIYDSSGRLLFKEKINSDLKDNFSIKAPEQAGMYEVVLENDDEERGVWRVVAF